MNKTALALVVLILLGATSALAQEEALSAVGSLGAAYLYTTYISIGSIADGHYAEVYDDETAVQILEEVKSLASNCSAILEELLASDILSMEDFSYINEMINALALLARQADSYQSYIQTGEERQATLYDNYRNSAWSKISDLLGIEE